jgi:hypothetical protein
MSVSDQRAPISSISSTAKEKQSVSNLMKIDDDDNSINSEEEISSKIKINAPDKYYEDRTELKN